MGCLQLCRPVRSGRLRLKLPELLQEIPRLAIAYFSYQPPRQAVHRRRERNFHGRHETAILSASLGGEGVVASQLNDSGRFDSEDEQRWAPDSKADGGRLHLQSCLVG